MKSPFESDRDYGDEDTWKEYDVEWCKHFDAHREEHEFCEYHQSMWCRICDTEQCPKCIDDPRCPECHCSLFTDWHEWYCSYRRLKMPSVELRGGKRMKSNFNLGDLNIEDTIQAGTIVLITEGAHDDYKITGVFRADVDVVVPFRPSKWLKDSKTIDTDKLSTMLTEVPYAEAYGDD